MSHCAGLKSCRHNARTCRPPSRVGYTVAVDPSMLARRANPTRNRINRPRSHIYPQRLNPPRCPSIASRPMRPAPARQPVLGSTLLNKTLPRRRRVEIGNHISPSTSVRSSRRRGCAAARLAPPACPARSPLPGRASRRGPNNAVRRRRATATILARAAAAAADATDAPHPMQQLHEQLLQLRAAAIEDATAV